MLKKIFTLLFCFISSGLGENKDDEIIAIINDSPKRIIIDSFLSNIYQVY